MPIGPFDRFNDRAKRVLALAQDEAIRFNHNYIGTEHLLLGLVREGEGVAARALDSLGIELSKVRTAVEFTIGRGKATTSPSEITLSPRTKKVIELAIDEARKLGHSHVGTEHLLLGLVREGEGIASGVLESLGVSLEKMRHQVIATLGQHPPERAAAGAHAGGPFTTFGAGGPIDRLDGDANRALARAFWEAGRANQDEIRTEHLLLALVRSDSAWLRRAWTDLAIDLEALATKLAAAAPPREGPPPASLSLGTELGALIGRALTRAAERNSALARPEHLLLAIVDEPESAAAKLLASLGATRERVREIVDRKAR